MVSNKQQKQAPSSEELMKAIEDVMQESKESLTAKDVREKLLKENITWNIPERRVAKFVKKQSRTSGSKTGFFGKMLGGNKQSSVKKRDDSTSTPETHPGDSQKNTPPLRLIKAFTPKKQKQNGNVAGDDSILRKSELDTDTENTMLANNSAEVERKESAGIVENAADKTQEVAKSAEANTSKDETPMERDDEPLNVVPPDVYVDDNDGKSSPCACGGCVIL